MDTVFQAFLQNEQLMKYLGIMAAMLVLISIFKTPWFKGKVGEFLVNLAAKIHLDKNTYHIINDVTLPSGDGTTQIDHIIVSIYGVFVVETKFFRGWIFGSEKEKVWTQTIYRNKYKFQNPLHQNYKHVQTLKQLLQLSDEQIFSLVVFTGDSQFKSAMPENVAFGGRYVNYILSKTTPVLTEEQVNSIIHAIQNEALIKSFTTNRAHKKHVQELQTKRTPRVTDSSEPVCPNCGSSMVKRTVKRGEHIGRQFWGCSEFPKCRGVVA